jgi:CO dehydrogenase maturation factor
MWEPRLLRHNHAMKIAIAGKGGSGKTTIAGSLARLLVRRGASGLIAIDADSNPNLAITLGIPRERQPELRPLDRQRVVKRITDDEGKPKTVLAAPPEEIISEFGIAAADGVTLLLMGRVEHAGAG